MHTSGLHHVTAIAGDPQRNRDFYEGVLGLRLVKMTVNFDDPGTYHLYYGDGTGSPGTILTFFPIPGLPSGTPGAGVTDRIALAVPAGAVPAWRARLEEFGLVVEDPDDSGGHAAVFTRDPDGLLLELVESDRVRSPRPWTARVDAQMAVQGVDSVRLASRSPNATGRVLTDWLGLVSDRAGTYTAMEALGGTVRVWDASSASRTRSGAGVVHHIAFRSTGPEEQVQWLEHIRDRGGAPTPVQDREYFTSVYFREPGGVLFEIATDPPGFTRDEPLETLGSRLCLPPWYEAQRALLEEHLGPLAPAAHGVAR
jgi:glyoxalase family protein